MSTITSVRIYSAPGKYEAFQVGVALVTEIRVSRAYASLGIEIRQGTKLTIIPWHAIARAEFTLAP